MGEFKHEFIGQQKNMPILLPVFPWQERVEFLSKSPFQYQSGSKYYPEMQGSKRKTNNNHTQVTIDPSRYPLNGL